ncbi:MAG: sortase [Ruminococcaceae bacterium]|nr:sortase [Oscillospiraceae bacterium]MBR2415099.1 sortase [Clostridia bacterium]
MKRKTALAFMTVGALCICFALGLLIYNNHESNAARDNALVVMDSIRIAIAENEQQPAIVDPFDEEMTVKEIDGYGYIGYLSIPALALDLPVMSEWDYDRLTIAPCRYYGSTKTDNLVIAAHNYRWHFGYLGHLNPGDTIIFTDMDSEVRTYKVDSVELLLPTDTDKVKDTGNDLILYTCTYGGEKRITVRCSSVSKP